MKKILVATALFSMGLIGTTSMVEASWLSKAWNRLETSSNNLAREKQLPTEEEYAYAKTIGWHGERLPKDDLTIAGVGLGMSEASLNSLGPADRVETNLGNIPWAKYHYGSITYHVRLGEIIKITVQKRDAVTHRGIAVGDSLLKVYDIYGRPVNIQNHTWWYGKYLYPSDQFELLEFKTDGKKVTEIILELGL